MRLWHKDLISVLPRQQLLAQWRECCCIARNIAVNGTPNHILVNNIMKYPIDHFIYYSYMVEKEMIRRGYRCDWERFEKHVLYPDNGRIECSKEILFNDWRNYRYLKQCLYNLQEKYDCGGITEAEWENVLDVTMEILKGEK